MRSDSLSDNPRMKSRAMSLLCIGMRPHCCGPAYTDRNAEDHIFEKATTEGVQSV
jgi:hypothetical protein